MLFTAPHHPHVGRRAGCAPLQIKKWLWGDPPSLPPQAAPKSLVLRRRHVNRDSAPWGGSVSWTQKQRRFFECLSVFFRRSALMLIPITSPETLLPPHPRHLPPSPPSTKHPARSSRRPAPCAPLSAAALGWEPGCAGRGRGKLGETRPSPRGRGGGRARCHAAEWEQRPRSDQRSAGAGAGCGVSRKGRG